MLDDYIDDQKITYKIIKNSFIKNRCSHAYLLETNGYPKSLEFAISFAKAILCPYNYTSDEKCHNCFQCKAIDNNNFIEFKIINPDGEWIKKEQLDELQSMFSKKAIIGNKKVYIINGVEKLNISSSNSILKFLEEPEEGIIAILITENINKVLSTIVSRCQVCNLKNINKCSKNDESLITRVAYKIFNSENQINSFIENQESIVMVKNIIDFVNYYESHYLDTFLELENLWNSHFNDRKDIFIAYEIMLLYYKDILNYLMSYPIEIFIDYKKPIQKISIKTPNKNKC